MAPGSFASMGSELVAYGLLGVYVYSGRTRYGLKTTLLFLLGSLYWTLILENVGVLMNFFTYTSADRSSSPFYLLWTGLTPLWVSIGWFDITFPTFMLLAEVLSRSRLWTKAIMGGFIAVSLDLIIDPAATAFGLWRWTHPSLYFLGVPVTNYIGWFLLTTFYLAVFESVHIKARFSALSPFKPSEGGEWKTKRVSGGTVMRLVGRLMVFQVIFIIIYVPLLYSIASIGTLPAG